MGDPETRRLFIGGLHHTLTKQDLRDRFSRHGNIASVEIKSKKDLKGHPIKTFAYLDISLSETELKKCMSTYNNSKWQGNTVQIQLAKESFLTKLKRERTEGNSPSIAEAVVKPKKPSAQAVAVERLAANFEKAGVSDFVVKGKVPGTQIDGEKNWVVSKYGRVLPVVYVRRKDKQKVVCCDPSKFSHHLKKFRDDAKMEESISAKPVSQLTWRLPEQETENYKKRKGEFPQARPLASQRKRVKDDFAVRREQFWAQLEKGQDSDRHQSNSEYSSDEDEGDAPETDSAKKAGRIMGSRDFEIVPRSGVLLAKESFYHTLAPSSAKPAFQDSAGMEVGKGYDSEDRDSVDTDELCAAFKAATSQTGKRKEEVKEKGQRSNPGLKRRVKQDCESEGSDDQLQHRQTSVKRMKTLLQGKGLERSQLGADVKIGCSRNDGGKDEQSSDSSEAGENEEEDQMSSDEGHSALEESDPNLALNFEPSIPKRNHLQTTSSLDDESEEKWEGKEKEMEEDQHIGEDQSLNSEQEMHEHKAKSNLKARLDFQPLILDRAAISEWLGTPEGKVDFLSKPGMDSEEAEETQSLASKSNDEMSDGEQDEDCDWKEELNKRESDEDEVEGKGDEDDLGSELDNAVEDEKETPRVAAPETSDNLKDSGDVDQGVPKKKLSKAEKKQLKKEKAEKQKIANEKRLEAMRQQQRAMLDRKTAIKGALAAVDAKEKTPSKHITFDSDEDESTKEEEGSLFFPSVTEIVAESGDNERRTKITLFDSDREDGRSSSSGDSESDDDEERFRIKPQYEGEAGQRLIHLEERYGGDTRFKLDTRFLEEVTTEGQKNEREGEDEEDMDPGLLQEKQRSLDILQSMIGTPIATTSKSTKEPNFRDPRQLHYDPSREEHSRFEIATEHEEESDAKKMERELRKEKRKLEEERAKVPEVSKEKFFQVSSNLKDAFSRGSGGDGGAKEDGEEADGGRGGDGGMFTFFGGDDNEDEDNDAEAATNADLAPSLFPSKRFKYDSSDDEHEGDMDVDGPTEPKETTMEVALEENEDSTTPQAFFFQSADPRLREGPEQFCRPKDHSAMVAAWEVLKAQLQNDFRKRHQKAVRDQKTAKKWQKKKLPATKPKKKSSYLTHHISASALRCGSRLYAGRGIIKSPNFPGKYPSDVSCEWTLISEDTGHVTLTFEAFELEDSPGCYYDYVEVYDGETAREPLLGKFCGTSKPRVITSSTQMLFVRFITDSSIERLGFSANYSTGCSRTLFGPRGSLTSPNYPERYLDNLNCVFKIVVGRHKVIRLRFRDFSVEGGTAYCSYDYLEIRDGSASDSKSVGRFCGEQDPGELVSTGNTMMLRFVTDESVKLQGFMLEYEAIAVDASAADPCMASNGGCREYCRVDGDGNAVCGCSEGYELDDTGKGCVDIDECRRSESCPHICVNLEGSYRCECLPGFEVSTNGKACDDVNECETENGGCSQLCFNTRGSFHCSCRESGTSLAADGRTCAPEAVESSCRVENGGCEQVCHERHGGHYCSCHSGYNLGPNGINCTDVDECLRPASEFSTYSSHCNQQCINTPGSYYCDCNEGFELSPNGRVCKDVDECSTELRYQCEHECTNFPGGFRCQCYTGFRIQPTSSSIQCVDINECDPQPEDCHECTNLDGGFECACREGFITNGNSTGCLDINECDTNNGGCQHVCVNLPGSHECRCRTGFQGTDLTNNICVDIDECAADRSGPCDHLCTNTDGSFECSCQSGYYLREDRLTCSDIDECHDNNAGCSQQCVNIPGGSECQCFEGFRPRHPEVIDSDVCVDIDECQEATHQCVAAEEAICENTLGNYTCSCPNGFYTHDWIHCRDIDECSNSSLNSCQQVCNNNAGGHSCSCEDGFLQINATHCQDINECELSICDHNDLCVNTEGSFTCRCYEGFFLTSDGLSCSDVDECKVNNGGCQQICINDRGGHRCDCEEGYELKKNGKTCRDKNECDTDYACCNQMHNCLNLPGTYTCSCDPGFYMDVDNCTCLDINECELNHGGCEQICVDYPGGHNCSCSEGFELYQESSCIDINECLTDNGGCDHFCTNYRGSYNCSCQANSKLGVDGHTCRSCPTCENFEELQEMLLDQKLVMEHMKKTISELRQNNTQLEIRLRKVEDHQSYDNDKKLPGEINVIN